jgi:hypothetical protein
MYYRKNLRMFMSKLLNAVTAVSSIVFFAATPLKADLSVALVVNETGEDITLECGNYTLFVPAFQKRQPLRLAVTQAADYAAPMISVGNEYNRVYFWQRGADLVCEDSYAQACSVVLKNMDIAHSAGLLIRVTPEGVVFRLLASFEKSVTGVICA